MRFRRDSTQRATCNVQHAMCNTPLAACHAKRTLTFGGPVAGREAVEGQSVQAVVPIAGDRARGPCLPRAVCRAAQLCCTPLQLSTWSRRGGTRAERVRSDRCPSLLGATQRNGAHAMRRCRMRRCRRASRNWSRASSRRGTSRTSRASSRSSPTSWPPGTDLPAYLPVRSAPLQRKRGSHAVVAVATLRPRFGRVCGPEG